MSNIQNAQDNSLHKDSSGKGLFSLILVCFFVSGMTGLIYQILWTRMLVKVIGGAPFAISIVLTIFMGGLGLGSYLASRIIDKITDALKLVRIYGWLEIIIGIYCLIFPAILIAARPLYAFFYNHLFEYFYLYNFLTFLFCLVLLILPVVCMGATLPILCRFYVQKLSHLGDHVGRLYGLNTIGAALGALLAGFWLIAALGMNGTLAAAVMANILIGIVAIFASKTMSGAAFDRPAPPRTSSGQPAEPATLPAQKSTRTAVLIALIIFAVSGFCSMAYEVIWTKLLGLIIGPTTYSFTIVLVTFITGLAVGAMLFGRLADKVKSPLWLLINTQVLAGLLALLVSQLLGNSQFFFAKLIYENKDSFFMLNASKALVLFLFMLPPTLCLGSTFPLVGKIYTYSLDRIGKSVGFAYAINTIGAVLGSFCAGFLIIPLIGKENGLRLVFSIQITAALIAAAAAIWSAKQHKIRLLPVAVLVLIGAAIATQFPKWDRQSLAYGRYHRLDKIDWILEKSNWFDTLIKGRGIMPKTKDLDIVYYGDGIGGFTVVSHDIDMFGTEKYSLILSGKPDASSYGDMPTQVLSAHIPMAFHPNPKDVMVLGHASGITSGEALNYPIETLDILEISAEVMEASHFFDRWNGNVLEDPRSKVIVQDGRAHLDLTKKKYDVIISEPSNPWMAGLAALFTEDFFTIAKDALKDRGIFAQFIHSYQMDWESFAMVGRTFARVFDKNAMVQTLPGDYLMLGFKGIDGLQIENVKRNMNNTQKSQNLTFLNPTSFYGTVMSEDMQQLFGYGKTNSDLAPHLEFLAPKMMYTDDQTIPNRIAAKRHFKPATREIIVDVIGDVDAQIDFVEMMLSVYGEQAAAGIVKLELATTEQKQRFLNLMDEYVANNEFIYEPFRNPALKARWMMIQIQAILKNLDKLEDKVPAYAKLADLYRQTQQFSNAESYYKKALDLIPDSAPLHNDLAVVLHLQGRLVEAVQHYEKALQLRPGWGKPSQNLEKAQQQLANTK